MHSLQRFHHRQFADGQALADLKNGQRVSVCIPTLDEAESIARIVTCIRQELMEKCPLVDEILVIDSGSSDGTLELARAAGATASLAADIAPETGNHPGKGENLWKSLHVAHGDLICYIDGDISNFHPGFVTGLVGPLLTDPGIDYVKAYYERPLARPGVPPTTGGGRVSEILVRPLVSMFYPELAGILQPLSGEYAARRTTLESLAFPTGYGVEIAHLIDLTRDGKLGRLAQTDLVRRVHRNRGEDELGAMAFALLKVVIRRLHRDGRLTLAQSLPDIYQTWVADGEDVRHVSRSIPEPERPPLGHPLSHR